MSGSNKKPDGAWVRSGVARYLIVYLIAALGLCLLAGTKQLSRPSENNHFVHLADGWLKGRLHHEGPPPGYCSSADKRAGRCRGHRYDDWAVLHTLDLNDGGTLRAYPCKTSACKDALRHRQVRSWIVPGEKDPIEIPRRSYTLRSKTWYVSFPPGPAVVFLPFVLFFGLGLWDVLLTCLIGAWIPVVLLRLLDRERGTREGRSGEHLWLAAAWCFATPACFLAANGRVWFTAQIVAALFLSLYISMAWGARRPWAAGLCLGMAVASRPFMLLALPFFAIEWWRNGRSAAASLHFVLPLGAIGVAIAGHNYLRFEDIFEFGHRYLDIRWQVRMQEIGMFSLEYVPRNLRCLFTLLPQATDRPPYFRSSVHGSSLFLGAPWLLAPFALPFLNLGREQRTRIWRVTWPLLLCLVAVAVPALFYQNSGQMQFSYRFAVNWLPFAVVILGFMSIARRRWFQTLVLASALFHLYGAYQFSRAPAELFVTKPPLWPFESEQAR